MAIVVCILLIEPKIFNGVLFFIFVAKYLIKYPIVYSFSSKSTTKNISLN